jgi:DNA-binding transcriptional ArsR family regulator
MGSHFFFQVRVDKVDLRMDPGRPHPDDVLAHRTRARLFEVLGELKRPAGTAELSERLHLHPNGVRTHLERMAEAGLVARARASQTRGRPRDAWTIAPDAHPGDRPPEAYRDLGRWPARPIRSRPSGLRGIEQTGRQIGRELAPSNATTDPDALETLLTALGFQPTTTTHEDDRQGGIKHVAVVMCCRIGRVL